MGINGLDLQAAYAPTNGLGLLGSFSTQGSTNNNSHTYGELGAGWFLAHSGALVLGAYGGLGIGAAHGESAWYINGNKYEASADGRYLRPFAQGNIGLHTQVVDAGLVLRFANVAMTYEDDNTIPQLPEQASHAFFEPVVYLGVGYDPIKVSLQAGFSTPLGNRLDFAYQPFIYSVCLSVDLNLLGNGGGD